MLRKIHVNMIKCAWTISSHSQQQVSYFIVSLPKHDSETFYFSPFLSFIIRP